MSMTSNLGHKTLVLVIRPFWTVSLAYTVCKTILRGLMSLVKESGPVPGCDQTYDAELTALLSDHPSAPASQPGACSRKYLALLPIWTIKTKTQANTPLCLDTPFLFVQ